MSNKSATKKLISLTAYNKFEEGLKSSWVENNLRESKVLEKYVPQVDEVDIVRPLKVKNDVINCSWDMKEYQDEQFKICVPVTAEDFETVGHLYNGQKLELETEELLQFVRKLTLHLQEEGRKGLHDRVSVLCESNSELNRLATSSFLNMGTEPNSAIANLKKDWSNFSNVFDSDFGMGVPLTLVYYTVNAEVGDYNQVKNIELHPYMLVTET